MSEDNKQNELDRLKKEISKNTTLKYYEVYRA